MCAWLAVDQGRLRRAPALSLSYRGSAPPGHALMSCRESETPALGRVRKLNNILSNQTHTPQLSSPRGTDFRWITGKVEMGIWIQIKWRLG